MLYIIGGAPRSGKTILSKRIMREKQIAYFPTDALVGTLEESAPELDISFNHPLKIKPQKTWKLLKSLCYFFENQDTQYLLEGDTILPSQVKELIDEGREVKGCFLGYTKMTTEEKLQIIRKHNQGKSDWTNDESDEEMTKHIDQMIDYGKYLKEECEKCGIPFFDVSDDFQGAHDAAFDYLFPSKV